MNPVQSVITGKNMQGLGVAPAICLVNPKYPVNVGNVVRVASCFNVLQVWFTGNRVSLSPQKGYRLPREERMKGYKDVTIYQNDYFFDQFERGVTPVAIELVDGAESLPDFDHPENAIYVFGPEDGSITSVLLQHCHRFVKIPVKHCLNLANTVGMVMYDRMLKLGQRFELNEHRGFIEDPEVVYSTT
jgi:tRNA(Leu) C34 or U34 (ribose-2'-O)-methylase TrmL